MTDLDTKQAVKEAVKEWLDEKVAALGWWTIKTIAAFILVGVITLVIRYGR